jgi:hypothetical protein
MPLPTLQKARAATLAKWGSLRTSFRVTISPADPEQSAKGLQMRIATEKDFPIECQECFQPARDCLCEVYEYKGTISFKSDQELTPEQLDQIVFALQVQMEEPADEEGNDEEFSTFEVLVSLEVSE